MDGRQAGRLGDVMLRQGNPEHRPRLDRRPARRHRAELAEHPPDALLGVALPHGGQGVGGVVVFLLQEPDVALVQRRRLGAQLGEVLDGHRADAGVGDAGRPVMQGPFGRGDAEHGAGQQEAEDLPAAVGHVPVQRHPARDQVEQIDRRIALGVDHVARVEHADAHMGPLKRRTGPLIVVGHAVAHALVAQDAACAGRLGCSRKVHGTRPRATPALGQAHP